jgi:N-acetylneuraminic acid mutarotase
MGTQTFFSLGSKGRLALTLILFLVLFSVPGAYTLAGSPSAAMISAHGVSNSAAVPLAAASAGEPQGALLDAAGDPIAPAPALQRGDRWVAHDPASPAQDEWEWRASMPTARSGPAAVAASDGTIYAIGGRSGSDYLDTVERYDPGADTWTERAAMPTARGGLAAAQGSDGKIYVFGGYQDYSAPMDVVEAYDPATDSWTTVKPMPTARSAMGAVAATDGKIYVIGGRSATAGLLHTVEIYDPLTNNWTTGADMPTQRDGLELVQANDGKIYAVGGRYLTSDRYWATDAVEAYDPAGNTWETRSDMPTPRSGLGVALASNGRIYACGGANTLVDGPYLVHTRYAAVEEYDPTSDTWAKRAYMQVPRSGVRAVEGADRYLYAIGGSTYDNVGNVVYLTTNERYTVPGVDYGFHVYAPVILR